MDTFWGQVGVSGSTRTQGKRPGEPSSGVERVANNYDKMNGKGKTWTGHWHPKSPVLSPTRYLVHAVDADKLASNMLRHFIVASCDGYRSQHRRRVVDLGTPPLGKCLSVYIGARATHAMCETLIALQSFRSSRLYYASERMLYSRFTQCL